MVGRCGISLPAGRGWAKTAGGPPTVSNEPSCIRSAVYSSSVPGRCRTACCRLRALGESTADRSVPRTWHPLASSCRTSSCATNPVTPVTATVAAMLAPAWCGRRGAGVVRARSGLRMLGPCSRAEGAALMRGPRAGLCRAWNRTGEVIAGEGQCGFGSVCSATGRGCICTSQLCYR